MITLRNLEIKDTHGHGLTLYSGTPHNNYWVIDNVIFKRCGGGGNYAGMFLAGTNYVKINNVVIDSAWQHGIYNSFGHDLQITNSSFTNNGYGEDTGSGLSIRSDSNVVVDNCISNFNASQGIHIATASSADSISNVIISNNIMRNNGETGVYLAYVSL